MTAVTTPSTLLISFGDVEAGLWGMAWADGQQAGGQQLAMAGTLEHGELLADATLEAVSPEADWTLRSSAGTLRIEPAGESFSAGDAEVCDQLCRVSGELTLGGAKHRVDSFGRRAARAPVQTGRLDSLRDFSAWFGSSNGSALTGLALTASRPRGSAGHDGDVISAVILDAGESVAVEDPRLSTTYDAAGTPARVTLELWLEAPEGQEQLYPRRASGEVLGPGARAHAGKLEIGAFPFSCISGGAEGAGVYLLVREG